MINFENLKVILNVKTHLETAIEIFTIQRKYKKLNIIESLLLVISHVISRWKGVEIGVEYRLSGIREGLFDCWGYIREKYGQFLMDQVLCVTKDVTRLINSLKYKIKHR